MLLMKFRRFLPFSFVTDTKFIVISPLYTWIKNSNPGTGQSGSCVAIVDQGFRAVVRDAGFT